MYPSSLLEIKRGMVHRFGGSVDQTILDTVAQIAPIFKRNSLEILFTMREALSQRDRERLLLAAHTLKGTSGNLGLERLSAMCEELEQLAQEDAFAAAALELRNVAAEYRQAQLVLDELAGAEERHTFFQDVH